LLDKIKSLLRGKETQVKSGIDTASDKVEKAVGEEHADKVDAVSEKAKDAVDDLTKSDDAAADAAGDQASPPPSS
jgi:hypothetical protein